MTPHQFYTELKTHVTAVVGKPWVPVAVGEAPDDADLYIVIWPAPGTPVDDRAVTNLMGTEATALDFQVTAVADSPGNLLLLMQDVTAALTEVIIGGHLVRPDVITNRAVRPFRDETLRPVRHYMATTWHTTLTRSTTNA